MAAALAMVLPWLAGGQPATLQIHVTEGEGAVHAAGSRSARPLVVEVTDEFGKPVARAAVSFHLPDGGPGGVFPNDLRTEVAVTDAAGRAAVHGIQWNRIPGRFSIRIVASFDQVRAGMISQQYIDGPAAPPVGAPSHHIRRRSKWLWIGAVAAGGAAAGLAVSHAGGGAGPSVSASSVAIGAPSITLGKP